MNNTDKKNICGVEYLGVALAAEYIGIHPETLKTETRKKKVSVLKLNGSNWYLPEWLENYITSKTQNAKFKGV